MGGIQGLSVVGAQKIFELAVIYKRDPLVLAKAVRTKILKDSWGNPFDKIEEIRIELSTAR